MGLSVPTPKSASCGPAELPSLPHSGAAIRRAPHERTRLPPPCGRRRPWRPPLALWLHSSTEPRRFPPPPPLSGAPPFSTVNPPTQPCFASRVRSSSIESSWVFRVLTVFLWCQQGMVLLAAPACSRGTWVGGGFGRSSRSVWGGAPARSPGGR